MHGGPGPSGYIADAVGVNTTSTPSARSSCEIGVEGPRIGVEILAGPELQRIDEDRHHHDRSGHPLGGADQREVAFVQRTHGGHQHHPASGVPQRPTHLGHRLRRRIDVELHRR